MDSSKVMLFGFSTGAYLIFGAVKDRPEIAAIGVRSLLSSFDDTMPLLKKLSPERNLHFPSDYPKEAEPINAAEKIKCPVFMVVGEKDFQTPPWMSKKVFDKLEGNKLLWIAKNAVHGGGNGPEYKYSEKFFPLFRTFINNSYSGDNYSWAKVSYSTDKSRVKHVVYELAQQAGFGYSWEKSESQTDSLCHNFVFNINIEKKSLAQALEDILNPIGLTYKIEDGSIVLFKK